MNYVSALRLESILALMQLMLDIIMLEIPIIFVCLLITELRIGMSTDR